MHAIFRATSAIAVLTMWVLLNSGQGHAQDNSGPSAGSPWNVNWGSRNYVGGRWTPLDDAYDPLEFGGWISTGFTANAHGNRSGNGNAPLPINNVSDGMVMNQLCH